MSDERARALDALNTYVSGHTSGAEPDATGDEVIDVHFFRVTVDDDVDARELARLIEAAHEGYFCAITPEDLKRGVNYITLGAWIGDQGQALRLMALGQAAKLWNVVTPATMFGTSDDPEFTQQCNELAGSGFVFTSRYTPPR